MAHILRVLNYRDGAGECDEWLFGEDDKDAI
jgi:hypothetical protein